MADRGKYERFCWNSILIENLVVGFAFESFLLVFGIVCVNLLLSTEQETPDDIGMSPNWGGYSTDNDGNADDFTPFFYFAH